MSRFWTRRVFAGAAALALPIGVAGTAAASAPPGSPVVVHVGQIDRQDIPSQPGSEPDTLVEPDVAVSPLNPDIAVAAAHDSRFPDGGAVDISYSWTHDGGAHWQHAPVQQLTTATGGDYQRASDPVVAFGPDGTAYLSALVFDATTCRTGVAVLRSTDGGATFGPPVLAHQSSSCNYSDDKNWLIVDNQPTSPHRGRLYQFWTPFISTPTTFVGSPQAVRYSDDHGQTWSATSYVTPTNQSTQNSQPMVLRGGTLVDTYYDFGRGRAPDVVPESPLAAGARANLATPSVVNASGPILSARSTDGGQTWSFGGVVTNAGGGYAPDVRCCLFGADIDAVTGEMYVAYEGGGPGDNTDPVELSSSYDGIYWSSPVRVSQGDTPSVQRVNVDVVARGGRVYVSYGTRVHPQDNGGFVQQQLSTSTDQGLSFGPPISFGQVSVLRYAARSRGYFPGDYIGSAITAGRIYVVWARSSAPPPYSKSPFHQVIDGATLRP